MLNLGQGNALLPSLAAGAAGGNGASCVIAAHAVTTACILYARVFASTDKEMGTVDKDKELPEIKNLADWLKAVLRLTQFAFETGRWQVAEVFAHLAYISQIVTFAQDFQWSAVIKYDNAFRVQKYVGHIGDWTDWSQRLYTDCFLLGGDHRLKQGSARQPRKRPDRKLPSRKGGKSGKCTSTRKSDLDWANCLDHKQHDGEMLCFRKQRTSKCNIRDCNFCHDDFCGLCGNEGHVAKDCADKDGDS